MDKKVIQNYLLEKGVPPNIKGFSYLTEAIRIYEPQMQICKVLYPTLGKTFDTSAAKVERAIRHAITHAEISERKKNSEFIAYAKLMLEREG